jgi:hypothetical protein
MKQKSGGEINNIYKWGKNKLVGQHSSDKIIDIENDKTYLENKPKIDCCLGQMILFQEEGYGQYYRDEIAKPKKVDII